MFNVDNKVKNIYYMLCYSFNKNLLTEKMWQMLIQNHLIIFIICFLSFYV